MADKLDELKNILLGDELRRFDTRFLEFGDKLRELSEVSGASEEVQKVKQYTDDQVNRLEDKLTRLQKDVKTGFEKIVETLGGQLSGLKSDVEKSKTEIEAMRKKFDVLKQLFDK